MNRRNYVAILAILSALAATLFTHTASAQARATADKPVDIGIFAGYSFLNTNYNRGTQPALVGGVDYTRFFRHLYLDPSLELRASYSPVESVVGQQVYSGGLKLEHRYARFHPYGDLLVGFGTVHFDTPPGSSDDSIVYTYGGGVDIDILPHIAAKVDAQGSHWHLGNEDTRYPSTVTVGFVYHLHFRDRFRQ